MASVYLTSPPRHLFKFPPDEQPYAIPPHSDEPTIKTPFNIPTHIYQGALNPKVPLTFAICYITIVLSLNAFNRSRGWKPWRIARTKAFTPLVAFHNLTLAVYSGITFAAMVRAVYQTWPVMDFNTTPADIADALCKINGPRGLGDAVTYNAVNNTWSSKNALIKLASDLPDTTDVGRLWNEGLGFWGWVFYLSKFYEVLDTLIILARGKRSPTLQTYHHAGAMLCMWAGIRYMSPPIWMFCFINSFIHTLMYIYFTLATLKVRVPLSLKQTLTTMQIAQFLFGATFAAFHLFVQYDVPVTTAYKVLSPISSIASAASSAVSSVVHDAPSSISSAFVSATATPALGAVLKRLLLRAGNYEGVAENVRDPLEYVLPASSSASSAAAAVTSAAQQQYKEETRYRSSLTTVTCIDTTGQSFAIWLNIFYLAPLTYLFARFFVKAYITGTLNKGKSNRRTSFTEGVNRAIADVTREADKAGREVERRLSEQVARDISAVREGRYDSSKKSADKKEANGKPDLGPELGQSKSTLSPESAILDDDSGDESHSGVDSSVAGSAPASPEKKKKRRNKKKKQHDAQHAGEAGVASFADVAKEDK
ncbi:GNS1/SUR4 family-domain-containing protein [Elsinoe ampelina]|uniref:Elongation of fatty acids protein n=1 Tax=Elsinoe ampelina TaxID=302913 RepID=A0A6A6FYJ6_9PEZI|nr:GNS1/SUR4 family-domain-containing protein [Elsinoe ampelina]